MQDFDSAFRINNLYRGKYVALNLNKTIPYTVNQDQSKVRASDGLNKELNYPIASYYGALKIDYQNQYGQIDSIMQIPTDSCVYTTQPSTLISYSTSPIFTGDVFINRYTEKNTYFFFNAWLIDVPNGTDYNYDYYYNGPAPIYRAEFRNFKADDFYLNISIGWSNLIHPDQWFDPGTPSDLHTLDQTGDQGGVRFHVKNATMYLFNSGVRAVSYTHLTLPTIYSV